MRAHVT